MKNILTISFILFVFVGCNTDDEPEQPSEVIYYPESETQKDAIDLFSIQNVEDFKYKESNNDIGFIRKGYELYYKQIGSDTICFIGNKKGRLWLGIYDIKTKNKLFEFYDNDSIKYSRSIYKGYSEYQEIKVNRFIPSYIFENNGHKVIVFRCTFNYLGDSLTDLYDIYFIKGSMIKKYMNTYCTTYENWFDNSIVFLHPENSSMYYDGPKDNLLFSKDGDLILKFKNKQADCDPISLTKHITVRFSNLKNEQKLQINFFLTDMLDSGLDTHVQILLGNNNIGSDVKCSYEIENRGLDFFIYKFKFTSYEGNLLNKTVKLYFSDLKTEILD